MEVEHISGESYRLREEPMTFEKLYEEYKACLQRMERAANDLRDALRHGANLKAVTSIMAALKEIERK